jgi:hypothetical protein
LNAFRENTQVSPSKEKLCSRLLEIDTLPLAYISNLLTCPKNFGLASLHNDKKQFKMNHTNIGSVSNI